MKKSGKHHDAICRICPDFTARSWDENLRHFEQEHEGIAQVKCGFCVEFFCTETQKKLHQRTCYSVPRQEPKNEETMICQDCGKTLSGITKFNARLCYATIDTIFCK